MTENREYFAGDMGFVYIQKLPVPLVGDGSTVIPATDITNKLGDKLVVIKSIASGATGLPPIMRPKDIFLHFGPERILQVGDEAYVFDMSAGFPAIGVDWTTTKEMDETTNQKDYGNRKYQSNGLKTHDISLKAFREIGNEMQEHIVRNSFRTIRTNSGGLSYTVEPEETLVAMMFMRHTARMPGDDSGVAALVTFDDVPNSWSISGISGFDCKLSLSSLANPTHIIAHRDAA